MMRTISFAFLALLAAPPAVAMAEPMAAAATAEAAPPAVATPKVTPPEAEAPEDEAVEDEATLAAVPDAESLDQEVQALKQEVLDLNRELFRLEEELLFPTSTQVALFLSMDVGTFFNLDSVQIKLDDKVVANYLYTEREVAALHRGGVHRIYTGNLRTGDHELVALFTGTGPKGRDYRRGTHLTFAKGIGPKYLELKIVDREAQQQAELLVKEWE